MLPDRDVEVRNPPVTEFLTDLRKDPIRWRATIYAWIAFLCCGGGVTYVFNEVTVFMGIFLFPSVFAAIGQTNATLLVMLFPLVALLAAIFLFREVYGFQLD
jgi:hypothetical protein